MSDAQAVAEAPPATEGSDASRQQLDRGLLRGLVWSGTAKWGGQLITWGSTLVIARLLTPADYGILGMALVFAGLLDLLTDLGLGSALVQATDLDQDDVEATMGATCLISLLAGLVVVAGAPVWAAWSEAPRLLPVVAVMGIGVVVSGVGSVPSAMLQRRLAFDQLARVQLFQGVVTALITLGLAATMRSYWALVIGLVAGKALLTWRVLLLSPVRPRLPFRNERVKGLLRFGGVLAGDRLLYYFRANFDLAIIGARLGGQALGIYMMATTLARMPIDKLGAVIGPVAYPIFARAQDDPATMRRHYVALNVGILTLTLPSSAGLILTADRMVPALLGTQWIPAVLPLQIMALFTPLILIWSINHSTLNAVGKVALNLRLTLAMTLIIPPAMLIGSRWGTPGVAAASGLTYIPVAFYGIGVTWRLIGLRAGEFFRPLLPAVSATAGMTLVILGGTSLFPPDSPLLLQLAAQVGLGLVSFPLWALLWHRVAIVAQWRALRLAWSA